MLGRGPCGIDSHAAQSKSGNETVTLEQFDRAGRLLSISLESRLKSKKTTWKGKIVVVPLTNSGTAMTDVN